jgi:Ca-activated chloride channel homolog
VYLRLHRRKWLLAARFSLPGVQMAEKKQPGGFRPHLPPLLFLVSLVIILVAMARPQAQVSIPRVEGTVVLVFDVSASMGADDVEPSRLEAAKAMAREFILSQPHSVQIGIIAFSGSGFAVQTPTNNSQDLLSTIDRLDLASGTSLGMGILSALNTIAVDAGLVENQDLHTPEAAELEVQPGIPQDDLLSRLPEGTYPASVIVLLTDGENNMSIEPLAAAQAAAERGVRIDALGFGTPAGTILEVDGFSVHTALDEATLIQITRAAGGAYYSAQSDQDPRQVYANLTPELVVKPEVMEITSIFAGASILILLAGSLFSLVWFNRLL